MFEEIHPLIPVHFFSFSFDLYYYKGKNGTLPSRYLIPDLSEFHENRPFAKVYLGWNEKGIYSTVEVGVNFSEIVYPDFRRGDSIEFFIDTRDMKNASTNTRFSHHFYFLPKPFKIEEGNIKRAGEITRFRGEESHPLAESSSLEVEMKEKIRGYGVNIFISKDALFGFNPNEFDRLGFAYRINSASRPPQFLSASEDNFSIDGNPSLWASVKMEKGHEI